MFKVNRILNRMNKKENKIMKNKLVKQMKIINNNKLTNKNK